jgi:hypothetical protein
MKFANTKRIQIYLAKSIKENCGRILTALVILAVIGKVIGYKTLVLILFAINLIQPTHAKKPTTIQSLHNTLLYFRFRINYNWLSSGFGEKQYREMEAELIEAIIQLQQLATPPPQKPTSTTKFRCSKQMTKESTAFYIPLSTKPSTNKWKKRSRHQMRQA